LCQTDARRNYNGEAIFGTLRDTDGYANSDENLITYVRGL